MGIVERQRRLVRRDATLAFQRRLFDPSGVRHPRQAETPLPPKGTRFEGTQPSPCGWWENQPIMVGATATRQRDAGRVKKQGVYVNQSKRWPLRPTWGWFTLAFVLSSILILPTAALGQPRSMNGAAPAGAAALLDGVLISPRHGTAFVMRPGGGIDAVHLASGALRWRSDRGARPLAIAGDRLVAQAAGQRPNALDLVVLDARSGAARDSVRIPLPDGVAATLVDAPPAPSGFGRTAPAPTSWCAGKPRARTWRRGATCRPRMMGRRPLSAVRELPSWPARRSSICRLPG